VQLDKNNNENLSVSENEALYLLLLHPCLNLNTFMSAMNTKTGTRFFPTDE
jgi:hypothetical protein